MSDPMEEPTAFAAGDLEPLRPTQAGAKRLIPSLTDRPLSGQRNEGCELAGSRRSALAAPARCAFLAHHGNVTVRLEDDKRDLAQAREAALTRDRA